MLLKEKSRSWCGVGGHFQFHGILPSIIVRHFFFTVFVFNHIIADFAGKENEKSEVKLLAIYNIRI